MSRFFKSAAFPIIIVVVLAFFAQRLILSNGTETQAQDLERPRTKADEGKITYIKTNTECELGQVQHRSREEADHEIGIPSRPS